MFWNGTLSWWLLIVAMVGDFAVPYLTAPFYKGYSHTQMEMSRLGSKGSPVKRLCNSWLLVQGVLFSLSAVNLYLRYKDTSEGVALALMVLILVFATGAGFIGGLFSVNDSNEVITVSSSIHDIGTVMGFSALGLEPLLVSLLMFKGGDTLRGGMSTVSFVATLACLGCYLLAKRPGVEHRALRLMGLWERAALVFMYLPLIAVAVKNILAQ